MLEYKILDSNDIDEIDNLERIRIETFNSIASNHYKNDILSFLIKASIIKSPYYI